MPTTKPSWGYPGNLTADSGRWSAAQQGLGQPMWVRRAADLVCTPVQAGTRQVSLSAGWFGGAGVVDELPAAHVVDLPAVTTGTRWFLIVARRTFGVTNDTTFEAIDAGTSANITLPAVQLTRGTVEDQPLWLVPLTAGQTVPGTPVDLRLIGAHAKGSLQANSELVLQFATWEGAEIVIGTKRWRRGSNTAGSAQWTWTSTDPNTKQPLTVLTGAAVITPAPGWQITGSSATFINRARRQQNFVDLLLQLRKSSGARIAPSQPGNFPDTTIATIAAALRPSHNTPFAFLYRGGTGTTNTAVVGGHGVVDASTGGVKLVGCAGDYGMANEASLYTFMAHLSFLQES